jgi:large conductance mechanosensitive channel
VLAGGIPVSLWSEFKDFLKEYKVMGLAVAFIMGLASTALVQSLVNDIIMPIITAFIPKGEWKTAVLTIGTPLGDMAIKWGSFLSQLINFIILAFVVFMIAKYVLREEKVAKK